MQKVQGNDPQASRKGGTLDVVSFHLSESCMLLVMLCILRGYFATICPIRAYLFEKSHPYTPQIYIATKVEQQERVVYRIETGGLATVSHSRIVYM